MLTGAEIAAKLDDEPLSTGVVINANAWQTLTLGDITGAGCRSYLLLAGGLNCQEYLGSRSTFRWVNLVVMPGVRCVLAMCCTWPQRSIALLLL